MKKILLSLLFIAVPFARVLAGGGGFLAPTTGGTPAAHASSHANGGSDPITGGMTVSSLTVTGSGESYGVIGTTQTEQRHEVNGSTPIIVNTSSVTFTGPAGRSITISGSTITAGGGTVMMINTSSAALALRTVYDLWKPDVGLGAATNTVVNSATSSYNGFYRMDAFISSGPTNGVLYKWRAPASFNPSQDLVLTDFTCYLRAADVAVSTYVIAINAYAASSERPTSFLLPITFQTIADASGAANDNESAPDTTLSQWAANITPGAQYYIYLGRLGGGPSTVDSFCGELHLQHIRSGTQ